MDQALKQFYGRKREARRAEMEEFRAKWIVPQLSLGSLASKEDSSLSLNSARGSKTQRLPKIWGAHPTPGRALTDRGGGGRGPRHHLRRPEATKGVTEAEAGAAVHPETSQVTFASSIQHASVTSTNATGGARRRQIEMKYYTAKVAPTYVDFERLEDEGDLLTTVALSLDGITQHSRPHRVSDEHHEQDRESFVFQPRGSPTGTVLVVKLLGSRRGAASNYTEIGTGLVSLTAVPVGGAPVSFVVPLEADPERPGPAPAIALELRLYARRKSFTLSFLGAHPSFRRAGYEITDKGLCAFPAPYKKVGLPPDVTLASLRLEPPRGTKQHEATGYEVWRATDAKGRAYTVKKFLVTDSGCRELLTAELDGVCDCSPEQTVPLLDAVLDGVKVVMVFSDRGGVYIRDAIAERGPVPEMVISIVLRQLAHTLQQLHAVKSRLHNDVDARNVQVGTNGEVRLAGFCYSAKHVGKASRFSGPFAHMAPERLLGLGCSFPSDVWSLGVLAFEMATGHGPYDLAALQPPQQSALKGPSSRSAASLLSAASRRGEPRAEPPGAFLLRYKRMVAEQPVPSLEGVPGASAELVSFVRACLRKNARARASLPELLAHPFIARFDLFTLPAGSWVTKRPAGQAPPSFASIL